MYVMTLFTSKEYILKITAVLLLKTDGTIILDMFITNIL